MPTYPFDQMPKVVATWGEGVKEGMNAAVQSIVEAGLEVIADQTPVDTTRAVSNWQVTVGGPAGGEVAPHVKGSVGGSGASAARSVTKSRGKAAMAGYKGGKAAYITNNVPYIGVLEYGDAKHRPTGMVAKGLQAMGARAISITIIKKE
jgi:hypothetical protein